MPSVDKKRIILRPIMLLCEKQILKRCLILSQLILLLLLQYTFCQINYFPFSALFLYAKIYTDNYLQFMWNFARFFGGGHCGKQELLVSLECSLFIHGRHGKHGNVFLEVFSHGGTEARRVVFFWCYDFMWLWLGVCSPLSGQSGSFLSNNFYYRVFRG